MTEKEEQLLNRLIATGGWLLRAIEKYRPRMEEMSVDGNFALFAANHNLEEAIILLRRKSDGGS